jgi:hypothetical protein
MSLQDFYAAAAATFVVIIFTKFLAHRDRRQELGTKPPGLEMTGSSGDRTKDGLIGPIQRILFTDPIAHWLHGLCVLTAWFGLLVSLAVLGWSGAEERHAHWWARFVWGLAFVSSTILALDVAMPPKAAVTGPAGTGTAEGRRAG